MNILFLSFGYGIGSPDMRAAWPCMWVNKYTTHRAQMQTLLQYRECDLLPWADVVVVHKQYNECMEAARRAKALGKVVVLDMDDYDPLVYHEFYVGHWVNGFHENLAELLRICDGVTVASESLARRIPGRVIENGFDSDTPDFMPEPQPYFEGPMGKRYKIAWGGGKSHARDWEMMLRLNAIQDLSQDFDADLYIYGVIGQNATRTLNRWRIFTQGGTTLSNYIKHCYSDADLLIAPLIQDEFNGCRSTLKLIEAGMAQKPIIASNVECYADYPAECRTVVDNTREAWVDAVACALLDQKGRDEQAAANRAHVLAHNDARVLTEQRIQYYEELWNAKNS